MSEDAEKIAALELKVKHLQEQLSKVGQPKEKRPQKAPRKDEKVPQNGAGGSKGGGKGSESSSTAGGADEIKIESSKKGGSEQHQNQQQKDNQHQQQQQQDASGAGGNNDQNRGSKGSSRLALFDHLPIQKPLPTPNTVDGEKLLHPSILKLGSMYRSGLIQEDDDRVAALLTSFCNVIKDYKTPPNKSLSWDLDKYIRSQVQYLVDCRPHCIGMGNLIKQLRYVISQISPDLNEADAKTTIIAKLHSFYEDRLIFARESIGKLVADVIHHNDVILTFGSTPLLRKVLLMAATEKKFRLIVVDTRPLNEGLKTLRALSSFVDCVYTPLSGAATVMNEATRVILGSSAMLSNGSMLAPAGTALISSLAKSKDVPVIAVCESYKFSEKVQLDSIVYNELGSAKEIAIASKTSESGNIVIPQLNPGYCGAAGKVDNTLPFQVLNLRYDCTPIGNISAVATETGLIPPTSIPVLIRELRTDNEQNTEQQN